MIKIDLLNFETSRYERKFFITELDLMEVENLIKFNSFMFKEIFYKRGISKEMLGFDGYKDIKKAASMNYNKANLWLKENQ